MTAMHDSPTPDLKRQKRCLLDDHLDDYGKPQVCELNAVVAVMSLTLAALGCRVAMLSECAQHLHTYLRLKAPGALIASDNNDKP